MKAEAEVTGTEKAFLKSVSQYIRTQLFTCVEGQTSQAQSQFKMSVLCSLFFFVLNIFFLRTLYFHTWKGLLNLVLKKKRQRSLQLAILVIWKLRGEECLCESITGRVSYSVKCPLLHLASTAWTFTLFQSWAKFHCQNTQTSFWKQNVNSSSHVRFPFLYEKVFHYKFNFFNR